MRLGPWYIHVALWLIYILLYSTLWADPAASFWQSFLQEVCLLPFKLILVYFSIGWLVPRLLFKKRYVVFGLMLALSTLVIAVLHHVYTYYVVHPIFQLPNVESLWNLGRITKRMTYLTTPMLVAVTLVVLDNFYIQKEINTRIAKGKLVAELKLLRSQLHPHLFFNALNSLYNLALTKSDLTAPMILRLADLMRYTLEESGRDYVKFSREIEFITNYVAIEKERFRNRVQVKWNICVSNPDVDVPPFILNTFVENVFKHCVSKSRETIKMEISLSDQGNYLDYQVSNTLIKNGPDIPHSNYKGVGLANLQQRLQLLYPEDHVFSIRKNESFVAYLRIPLKK